jgi:hypothetical protein
LEEDYEEEEEKTKGSGGTKLSDRNGRTEGKRS